MTLGADGSYTLMHADGTIDLGGSDRLAILLDPSYSAFKKFENNAYPVSYTHLDVYKRQEQQCVR